MLENMIHRVVYRYLEGYSYMLEYSITSTFGFIVSYISLSFLSKPHYNENSLKVTFKRLQQYHIFLKTMSLSTLTIHIIINYSQCKNFLLNKFDIFFYSIFCYSQSQSHFLEKHTHFFSVVRITNKITLNWGVDRHHNSLLRE